MIAGIGIDLVEVARIRELTERHGRRFLERTFTPAEIEYADGRARRDEHLAARFAAKEAAVKALGTGVRFGIKLTDVEVVTGPMGQPALRLVGEAARRASELGVVATHVSISHVKESAVAVVVLEK